MAIPGLKNIPSEFRDVYEHAYEILRRLRDRQAELTVLMEGEKNKTVRNKLSKERTNINRWLGDVTQAPETFTGIELSKYTDKQLGQRVHTVARSLMDKFNIDPRKASAGGSTQHHIDSIMQMQGAFEGAGIDTIFKINQSLKEKDIYLGTNAEGRNFYDVDASTHPDFHKLTPDEKVDYTNKWAKINAMPTATAEERIARLEASSEITRGIAERAAASPINQSRIAGLADAAESQVAGLGATTQELFLPGPKNIETVSDVRQAISKFIEVGGSIKLNANLLGVLPIAGTALGAATVESAAQAREEEIAANPNDPTLQVNKVLDQIAGWGDRTSLAGMGLSLTGAGAVVGVPMAAAGETVSLISGGGSIALDFGRSMVNQLKRGPQQIRGRSGAKRAMEEDKVFN